VVDRERGADRNYRDTELATQIGSRAQTTSRVQHET